MLLKPGQVSLLGCCPWAGLVFWWLLGWSQLTKLPACDGAEAAGMLSELRNEGKDGQREKAIHSTSSFCSPSGVHVVQSSHVWQAAWRHLLNWPDFLVLGSEGINTIPSGSMGFFSVQVGTDSCPELCCHFLGYIPTSCREHHLLQLSTLCSGSGGWHPVCEDMVHTWTTMDPDRASPWSCPAWPSPWCTLPKNVTNSVLLNLGSFGPWRIPSPDSEY